jgi:transposase-like protein
LPRKGSRYLQPREKDEIVALYQTTSQSVDAIAPRFGVGRDTVYRLLKNRGVALRQSNDRDDEIVALYQTTSMHLKDIAARFGVHRDTIRRLLTRRGVALRELVLVDKCSECVGLTSNALALRRCHKHQRLLWAEKYYRERTARIWPGRFRYINTKRKKYLGGFERWVDGLSDVPSLSISLRSAPSETGADLYFQADSCRVRWSYYQVGHFTYETIHEMVGRLLLLLEDYRRIDGLGTASERKTA